MLYGEDSYSIVEHMWVLENRRIAGNYRGDTFRELILAPEQFAGMTGSRSLDPKSTFTNNGAPDMIEIQAWEACVEMAYLYTETYDMSAIMIPFEGFDYTYTHSYEDGIESKYPNGYKTKSKTTWFYNKP